jgi:MoaA/NifB/PqqE/SkfB family radical SAM enzyme/SAM-dependent methyltransferase
MRGDVFFRQVAARPPFSRLHPQLAAFFKDYLAHEKVVRFGERFVLNTHFPPFPSPAFERLVEQFGAVGESGRERRLFSVTWAVTNRCNFRCWHCYNAGRSQQDLPLEVMKDIAAELQELGATVVTLTGGEPLLREDLEPVAAAFDGRTSLVLGTTGDGFTAARARALASSGVFAVGISLDSSNEVEHDRLRGRANAFRLALEGLSTAKEAGLYPYVVSVATREFLERGRFMNFLRFARDAGALEVHLLEPSATGKLAGRSDVLLRGAERRLMFDYQKEVAEREDLPVLSSFAYLESGSAFGCGAGLTHLYIDGSGEVCPCNLVPLSFGNARREPLKQILDRMGEHFHRPRCTCVGRQLARRIPAGSLPAPAEVSTEVCRRFLPRKHKLPRFFDLRSGALTRVGAKEVRESYDRVHGDYDEFWLVEAGRPVDQLVERLHLTGRERIFEAGCGTGYATRQLAERIRASGSILAVDLSEGMLEEARRRLSDAPGVRFTAGDALEILRTEGLFDLVFSSWVLGYIPLKPFFASAARALAPGGRLAFVVHKKDSPLRETTIFGELVAADPSVLLKQVDFDFPRDMEHVRSEMFEAGMEVEDLREGAVTFEYPNPEGTLEHLLKSGAGTAFYNALDPARRPELERRFLDRLAEESEGGPCRVVHDFVACIARKP